MEKIETNIEQYVPKGCLYCIKNRKTQLHLTFKCNIHCYFCPIPKYKFGQDIIEYDGKTYDLNDLDEILISISNSTQYYGIAISGGEPLLYPDRVLKTILFLKKNRGKDFHVHLYTNGIVINHDLVKELMKCGLDELRVNSLSENIYSRLVNASFDVICEVPCIPDESYINKLSRLVKILPQYNVKKLNLNELEVTKENISFFLKKGFSISNHKVNTSREAATYLLKYTNGISELDVYFCSFETMDKIRIARNRVIDGE